MKSVIIYTVKRLIGPNIWVDLKYFIRKLQRSKYMNAYYDHLTKEVIKKTLKKDSVCIDVGCHSGDILRLMMHYAPKGKFYAFEPLPDFYNELVHSFDIENVKIYNIALSNSKERSIFNYVVSNPGYSGLKKRRYDKPHEEVIQITVNTDLLDNIVDPKEKIHLIKIDVEGAELEVMLGAMKTIKRDKPIIIFEHGLGAADLYGTKPEDIYDLLCSECDLKISLLDDWLKHRKPLSREGFHNHFYKGLNYCFIAHS